MHVIIDGIKIDLLHAHTLVVGAGAAGLNCAHELFKRGIDVLLAADNYEGGTSLNAGSDKQTYHRMSQQGDSAKDLAQTLFAGGHMHGDIAYALAAGSARAFFKLVELGVPFPKDRWGEYIGYQTDHDERKRATSAGPLTSRFMGQCLGKAVRDAKIRTIRGQLACFMTSTDGKVAGALFYDPKGRRPLIAVLCGQAVLCTGGSADLYEASVHPTAQTGAMGAALRIGAKGTNLWSWQYGLASTDFRWNLSGTYQQVLPLYRDEKGKPVLEDWVSGNVDDAVFAKGYQWPFDLRKVEASSRVDLAVHFAIAADRQVYLDYRQADSPGRLSALGKEAAEYLRNSGADMATPLERLAHMNPAAIDLYRSHNIDLAKEPLRIAVCAQHQNGGLAVDHWWRTSVPGLYAAGEVAGCFGAYRPGGSALNETQVGSLRAAEHIAAKGHAPTEEPDMLMTQQMEDVIAMLHRAADGHGDDASLMHAHLRRQFSLCAGAIRRPSDMRSLYDWVMQRRHSNHYGSPETVLHLRDALDCAAATLSAMLLQAQSMPTPAGHLVSEVLPKPYAMPPQPDDRFSGQMIETLLMPKLAESVVRPVRPLPSDTDGWFENVWRAYREKTYLD